MSVGGLVFHRHTLTPLDRTRPPRLTLRSFTSGPLTLGTIQYSAGARVVTGSLAHSYQINIPLEGVVRTARGDQRMVATPRQAAVYGLHQHEFEGFEVAARVLGVKFDRTALERRLEDLLGRQIHGGSIEFDLPLALGGRRPREWFTIIQLLAQRLWSQEGLTAQSLVLAHLQDAAMTGLLLAARHSYRAELDDPVGPATPRAVRRAIAYVDSTPEASLVTVPELAAHAGVGIRALQAGFRQALETTPLGYLQDRRLTHARRELEAQDAASVTVAQIADRWGFAHHGRFSRDYRSRFGESPSQTLRR